MILNISHCNELLLLLVPQTLFVLVRSFILFFFYFALVWRTVPLFPFFFFNAIQFDEYFLEVARCFSSQQKRLHNRWVLMSFKYSPYGKPFVLCETSNIYDFAGLNAELTTVLSPAVALFSSPITLCNAFVTRFMQKKIIVMNSITL